MSSVPPYDYTIEMFDDKAKDTHRFVYDLIKKCDKLSGEHREIARMFVKKTPVNLNEEIERLDRFDIVKSVTEVVIALRVIKRIGFEELSLIQQSVKAYENQCCPKCGEGLYGRFNYEKMMCTSHSCGWEGIPPDSLTDIKED